MSPQSHPSFVSSTLLYPTRRMKPKLKRKRNLPHSLSWPTVPHWSKRFVTSCQVVFVAVWFVISVEKCLRYSEKKLYLFYSISQSFKTRISLHKPNCHMRVEKSCFGPSLNHKIMFSHDFITQIAPL